MQENDRTQLLKDLSTCPEPIFNKTVWIVNAPRADLPPKGTEQSNRAVALAEWAESSGDTELNKLRQAYEKARASSQLIYTLEPLWLRLVVASISVLFAMGLVGVARYLGLLQPLELRFFDWTVALESRIQGDTSANRSDPRILIVTIDDEDLIYQDQHPVKDLSGNEKKRSPTSSILDAYLAKLLVELEKLEPIVVGFDIYYQDEITSVVPAELLKQNRFFVTCRRVLRPKEPPTLPPKDLLNKFDIQGFSDTKQDSDKITRRHLVSIDPSNTNKTCGAEYSLNFSIALRYLIEQKDVDLNAFVNDYLNNQLTFGSGGYYSLDEDIQSNSSENGQQERGSQVLLKYRTYPDVMTASAAKVLPLREILENGIDPLQFQQPKSGLIVLIGNISRSTDNGFDDYALTPYGIEIPGVFLQAQMISQAISFQLDKRPLLGWTTQANDNLWILVWTFGGGVGISFLKSPKQEAFFILILGDAIVFLIILFPLCLIILKYWYVWTPLFPPICGVILAQGFACGLSSAINRYRLRDSATS